MKKLLIILGIFSCLVIQAQVFDLRTYKPISDSYYFEGDTLYIAGSISITKPCSEITGAVKIVELTNDIDIIKVLCDNVVIENLEITSTNDATTAISCSQKTVTVRNCRIHDVHYGMRFVSNAKDTTDFKQIINSHLITIQKCWIYNIQDDGIYGQYQPNWLIEDNYIFNVNLGGFPKVHTAGGDGIQIAYWQNSVIIRGNLIDHSNVTDKACLTLGATDFNGGSALIEDNILIGFSYYDKIKLDPVTQNTNSNNVCYLKPLDRYVFTGNILINGSGGIFEQGTHECYMLAYNNYFSGQEKSFNLSDTWRNNAFSNTFDNGIVSYFSGSAIGDYLTKNIFYSYPGLSITRYYNEKPIQWSALIDPVSKYNLGWGCNPELVLKSNNTKNQVVIDTITYYDSIPKYYDVTRYLDIYKVHNLDSIIAPILQKYFEKIQPRTIKIY